MDLTAAESLRRIFANGSRLLPQHREHTAVL